MPAQSAQTELNYFFRLMYFNWRLKKMDEYFEEDDKDIEVLYDSTTAVVKKEELKESNDVKKELEELEQPQTKKMKMDEYFEEDDKDNVTKKEEDEEDVKKEMKYQLEQELKLMASMNLPTQFVYSNGRFQDVKLKEECTTFCSLCQVKMRNVQAYEAHMKGNKHCKKLIATGLQRR